jgi:multidrug efflux system membrane fusion protein
MKKRTLVVGVAAGLALAGLAVFLWNGSAAEKAAAQGPRGDQRQIPVTVAKATKQSVPIRLEALGTVTTIASVAIKPRVDSEIIAVKFEDGARVKQGDVLFVLDSRSIETEMKRVEAVITGAEAQYEQASRDVARYTDLVAKNATTQVTLNNAQTQMNVSRSLADSNKATLEGLKVQLGYCTIRAPISGRISMANVKLGNIVRQADTTPLATINQMAPIYVSFTVAQNDLPNVRTAIAAETATLEAIVPGTGARASGQVTMVENTVDPATGMVTIRATMPNKDELLWPGTLVNTELTLRNEDRITVPVAALQASQAGQFVFVIKDGAAAVRPVKVERTVKNVAAIESGLQEGEVVVTDGQLQLSAGSKIAVRNAGS